MKDKKSKDEKVKHRKKKALRNLCGCLALLTAVLFFASCGGEAAPTELITAAPSVTAGVEQEVVQPGGQLRTYMPAQGQSLNPLLNDSKEMGYLLTLCYERLIDFDGNVNFAPSLAENWSQEEEGQEGLHWLISLRKNVKWHDGEPFTSKDVIYTFNLLSSPAYADSPYRQNLDAVAECIALDDYTIRVTGKEPGIFTLYGMTFPVLPAHAFSPGKRPIGTGPYQLAFGDREQGLRFEVNGDWWRSAPLVSQIRVLPLLDNDEALRKLDDHTLNFALTDSVTATGYREEGRTSVAEVPSMQSEMLLVNHNNALLNNPEIRKAIAFGIDRRDIITKAYLGHAFATDVPVPPHSWLYDSDTKVYDYNAREAAALLKAEGWLDLDGDGILEKREGSNTLRKLSFRLLVNDTPDETKRKDAANLIQQCLKEVGIEIRIVTAAWTNEKNEYLNALNAGNFDLALTGFYMNKCPDLSPYLSSSGSLNYGGYQSGEMDALLRSAHTATDENTLALAMEKLQEHFVEELPFIQLYFRTSSILFADELNLSSAAQLTEDAPFRGVERWYFDSKGLALFPVENEPNESTWRYFDTITPEERLNTENTEAEAGGEENGEGEEDAE